MQHHKKGLPLTPFVGRHAADVGLLLVYLHERQIGIKPGRCEATMNVSDLLAKLLAKCLPRLIIFSPQIITGSLFTID